MAIISIAMANTKLSFQLSVYRKRRAASFTIPAYKQIKNEERWQLAKRAFA